MNFRALPADIIPSQHILTQLFLGPSPTNITAMCVFVDRPRTVRQLTQVSPAQMLAAGLAALPKPPTSPVLQGNLLVAAKCGVVQYTVHKPRVLTLLHVLTLLAH